MNGILRALFNLCFTIMIGSIMIQGEPFFGWYLFIIPVMGFIAINWEPYKKENK